MEEDDDVDDDEEEMMMMAKAKAGNKKTPQKVRKIRPVVTVSVLHSVVGWCSGGYEWFFLFRDAQLNRYEVNRDGISIDHLANPAAPGKWHLVFCISVYMLHILVMCMSLLT